MRFLRQLTTGSVWPLSRVLLNAIRSSGEGNGDVLLAWERQMEEENAALDATIERYKEGLQKMVDRGVGTDMTSAQRLMLGWFNPLRTAIAREQQAVRPCPSPCLLFLHSLPNIPCWGNEACLAGVGSGTGCMCGRAVTAVLAKLQLAA